MKTILLFVTVAVLSVGVISSCGKSSKGKMEGDWNVDSMTRSNSYTSGSNSNSSIMTISGSAVTESNTNGSTTTTSTGTVNTATWSIEKDGQWERVLSVTFTGSNSTTTRVITSSGNWDFAEGVGEYKNKERVIFSTLSEEIVETTTVGSVSTITNNSTTHLDGENVEIYVIKESKNDLLEMEANGSSTSTNGSNSSTETESISIKMSM